MISLIPRLLLFPLKLITAPFRLITPRIGCLILALFAGVLFVLFVFWSMLLRLIMTFI